MGTSSSSLIEMPMCDAAFHYGGMHFFLTRIGPRWSYPGFASYKQEQDECLHITFQMVQPATRAKMCPTTCVVQHNDTSRRVVWFSGSSVIVFLLGSVYSSSVVPTMSHAEICTSRWSTTFAVRFVGLPHGFVSGQHPLRIRPKMPHAETCA